MNNFSEWKCLELIFRKNKIIFWRKINWQATNGTFAIASKGDNCISTLGAIALRGPKGALLQLPLAMLL